MAAKQTIERIKVPARLASDTEVADKVAMLSGVSLLVELHDSDLLALAHAAERVEFDPQDERNGIIFTDGNPGDEIYFICQGRVESFLLNATRTRIPLGEATGGLYGEVALLVPSNEEGANVRSATVQAITHTVALRVKKPEFLTLMGTSPRLALIVMGEMARRLSHTSEVLRLTSVQDVNLKLKDRLTNKDRVLMRFAGFLGSLRFVVYSLIATIAWYVVTLLKYMNLFDRSIGLLSLAVSIVALWVTSIVLQSQNRQMAADKIRNDVQFETTVRAEVEMRQMFEQIRELRSEMLLLQAHNHAERQHRDGSFSATEGN